MSPEDPGRITTGEFIAACVLALIAALLYAIST